MPPSSSDLCFLTHRYWDREVQQAAKDLRSPELAKVLVQCFWRPYSLIGAYMFMEVLSHRSPALQKEEMLASIARL